MVLGGLSGCGVIVSKIQKDSLMWTLSKNGALVRKGMALITLMKMKKTEEKYVEDEQQEHSTLINAETMTLPEVQDFIQIECRQKGHDVKVTFRTAPSRSLTKDGRKKKTSVDEELTKAMTTAQNLSSTVTFGAGPLGLELVGRKPRPETIEARIIRRKTEAEKRRKSEQDRVENEIVRSVRELTCRELFEGLDHEKTGFITRTELWKTVALDSDTITPLFESLPRLSTFFSNPIQFSKAITYLKPKLIWNSELDKFVPEDSLSTTGVIVRGSISWNQFYNWIVVTCCNEDVIDPLKEALDTKEREKAESLRKKQEKNEDSTKKYQTTGGVMISTLKKGGAAMQTQRLRRGMVLESVYIQGMGTVPVATSSLNDVLSLFQHRPIKTRWRVPPSRSLDKAGNKIHTTARVRFTERHGLSLGLRLVGRKTEMETSGSREKGGGVMIAEIVKNSPAGKILWKLLFYI